MICKKIAKFWNKPLHLAKMYTSLKKNDFLHSPFLLKIRIFGCTNTKKLPMLFISLNQWFLNNKHFGEVTFFYFMNPTIIYSYNILIFNETFPVCAALFENWILFIIDFMPFMLYLLVKHDIGNICNSFKFLCQDRLYGLDENIKAI